MNEVFNATGLDRMLLMARFIQNATPAELEEAVSRCDRENIRESTFADQLWLRWVEVDRAGALRHQPRESVWWALAKLDPDDALREAAKSGAKALTSVIFSIAQGDPARARQLLAEHPEVDAGWVGNGMMDGLMDTDPPAAMALAMRQGGIFADRKFRDWLNRDRDQATDWMRSLTNPAQRRRMEDTVAAELVESDPAEALKAARELPAGLRQFNHSLEAIAALARQDPAAAEAAVEAIPDPASKQRALAAMAGTLVSTDPAAAVALLSKFDWYGLATFKQSSWSWNPKEGGGSSGYSGADPTEELMRRFMSAAPEATVSALAALPLSAGFPISEAVGMWAGQQPEAASSWLKELPAGPTKDEAIGGLNQWLLNESPDPDYAASLAWSGAASPGIRESMMRYTLSERKNHDPKAAAAAVATLPVPEERKAELLKQLGLENQ